MNTAKGIEQKEKILLALEKVYDNLIAFKKSKDSPLVIMRDGKIVHVKPWEEDIKTPS